VKLFEDHKDDQVSYIVMPFLRPIDKPPFESVKEIIDFVDQILEVYSNRSNLSVFSKKYIQGLVFLHEKGVAHRYGSILRAVFANSQTSTEIASRTTYSWTPTPCTPKDSIPSR